MDEDYEDGEAMLMLANAYMKTGNNVAAMNAFKAASEQKWNQAMQEDAMFNYAKLSFDLNKDTAPFSAYIDRYNTSKRGDEIYGYYQWVTYTPNENVALHRDIIIEKTAYESEDWGEENLLNYLKQDNPYDPYWDQYGIDEAQWNAKPDTWYIAFSIGKNANGEWGPLASVEFKTPGTTGINEVADGKQVAGVRYYNLAGQEMTEANGLTIVVTTYTDGTTSTKKVMK